MEEKKPAPTGKYQVFLTGTPDREAVAQLIAQRTEKSIDEARRLVSMVPGVVATDINPLQAEDLVMTIKGMGGNAEKRLIFSSLNCPVHPNQQGRAVCQVCEKIICSLCLKSSRGKPICPECSGELGKIKIPFPWMRLVLILALIGAGVYAYIVLAGERAKFAWDRPFKLAVVGFMIELPAEWRAFVAQFEQGEGSEWVDLKNHTLPDMVGWFHREYQRYGGSGKALELTIFGPFDETVPPPPPPSLQGSFLDRFFQYLAFKRYFDDFNRHHDLDLKGYDGVIYVQFVRGKFDGFLESYASRRARMGLVNCFLDESMVEVDIMIVLHEFAHLLNAKDHYGADLNPVYPQGFVQPFEDSLYPQRFGELMAGKIPLTKSIFKDANSLREVRIGIYTANEIGWITDQQLQTFIQDKKTPPME